ncbi:beta-ketoacyl-[acyl-carrier-protein] synthase family protein [Streptomyces sp. L2]|uniref:beta-ketoacyl-[acyl-carrier-protein] synthase family protein n=1 Tax=Streptomyces sp. L2 TaxID=2162665 RepID=UPI001011A68E|nr:beta-ketoacyl-[acyl-carrier-protein] synthase family protein [Streptomyces sp. L2]
MAALDKARARTDTRGHTPRFDVAVTGLGLITPAGIGVEANWERVCSGVSAAAADPTLGGGPVRISCRVPGFDPMELLGRENAWRLDRFVQLAMVAARQAVDDAGLDRGTWDGARVGVVLGNSLGGTGTFEQQHRRLVDHGPQRVSPLLIPMSMMNMVSGYVAIDLGARGPNLVTATACASGATAIGIARELLRSHACDIVIAGASESALSPTVMAGLNQMGALSGRQDDPLRASRPFDADRDGFVAAEGAGVLVLERVEDARARGARIRANISGYGSSADAYHATAPDPSGVGVSQAVNAALDDAGLGASDVAHINAHGTSTKLNDETEAKVVHRLFGENPAVTSTKGVTGHTLGAAGAIEAAYTVLAVERGTVPPTANLTKADDVVRIDVVRDRARTRRIEVATSNSFGFGGHNAVLVVTAA